MEQALCEKLTVTAGTEVYAEAKRSVIKYVMLRWTSCCMTGNLLEKNVEWAKNFFTYHLIHSGLYIYIYISNQPTPWL
jgi:hypothetical protein